MELAALERRLKPGVRRAHELAARLVREEFEDETEFDRFYAKRYHNNGNVKTRSVDGALRIGNNGNKNKKRKKRLARKRQPEDSEDFSTSLAVSAHMTKDEKEQAAREQRENSRKIFEIVSREQRNVRELDLRPFLNLVYDQVLWELGELCPAVMSINLAGWPRVSVSGLRSIALGFGDRLEVLDLSECPLNDEMVKMLTARFFHLRVLLFRHCVQVSNQAMRSISEGASQTLKTLDISNCPKISEEGLYWLGGSSGAAAMACSLLESLAAERCTKIRDSGLVALGKGCRNLRFANFSYCNQIGNKGVVGLSRGCKNLQVLHLAGCIQITDHALVALGERCHGLRSLNLAGCFQITDAGLEGVADGTESLQALNISGCCEVSELGIFYLVNKSKSLQVLNVTGCELVTQRGLEEMMRGLEFVELARTYTGFKPIKDVAKAKLRAQLQLVKDDASKRITALIRGHGTRLRLARERRENLRQQAAMIIQCWIRGQFGRAVYLRMFMQRRKAEAAMVIQKAWRFRLGRLILQLRRRKIEEDKRNGVYAAKLQAWYRGRKVRRLYPQVQQTLDQMKEERWEETMAAVTVRLQAIVRGKISVALNRARREELAQRTRDMYFAVVAIQSIVRVKLCRLLLRRKRQWFRRKYARDIAAATMVQKHVRGMIGKRKFQDAYEAREREHQRMVQAAKVIQRVRRGQIGRCEFLKRLEEYEMQMKAATMIQKVYRCFRVPPWPILKFQKVKEQVQKRDMEVYEVAHEAVRRRIEMRDLGHAKDSASEDENVRGVYGEQEESDDDWQEHFDEHLQVPFYFSPSRNLRTYNKYSEDSFDLAILDKYVKVLDPRSQRWRYAVVTKFNRRKQKHRVDYYEDDGTISGDHAWFYTKEYESNMQIYDDDSETWGMLRNLRIAFMQVQKEQRQSMESAEISLDYLTGSSSNNNYHYDENDEDQLYQQGLQEYQEYYQYEQQLDQQQQVYYGSDGACWEQLFDPDSGYHYYHNLETGETSWEVPL